MVLCVTIVFEQAVKAAKVSNDNMTLMMHQDVKCSHSAPSVEWSVDCQMKSCCKTLHMKLLVPLGDKKVM